MPKYDCEKCNELARLLEEAENRIRNLIEERDRYKKLSSSRDARTEQLEKQRIDDMRGVSGRIR